MVRSGVVSLACATLSCCVTALCSPDTFDSDVKPFLKSNCVVCHTGANASGGLDLNRFLSLEAAAALVSREQWELISRKLAAGEMPPKGMAAPSADSIAAVRGWVESEYS